ncbi:MAG: acylneuraminate cytidylyltransferase family protein [Burkholderiales bacterium]|nr:acylneuraminate cytidylyltransferase family protein [Burkholderiales bacterium]
MIGGLSVLALITARGGSKGLPGKNVRLAAGRPLLAYTADAARASRHVDRLVLSTDDEEIMRVGRETGCEVPFRRPAALAGDEATSIDVVLHALDTLPRHDLVLLLQPTSPLRTAADIDAACELLLRHEAPACVSLMPVPHHPQWMFGLDDGVHLAPLLRGTVAAARRQELPPVYALNGAIYLARADWLRRTRTFLSEQTVGYVMPAGRSIDIDTLADFEAFSRLVS